SKNVRSVIATWRKSWPTGSWFCKRIPAEAAHKINLRAPCLGCLDFLPPNTSSTPFAAPQSPFFSCKSRRPSAQTASDTKISLLTFLRGGLCERADRVQLRSDITHGAGYNPLTRGKLAGSRERRDSSLRR